jgi:heterotetrameric sarcosine oxidase gamma subunit
VSAPDRSRSTDALLVVAERPRSLVCLMARKDKTNPLAAAIKAAFGLDLPSPGRWTAGAQADAIWVQPSGWLLESEPSASDALRARVAAATEGLGVAVDQSSGRSVIRFAGAPARSALATRCRLDLHPRAFGAGSAAMTRVAHVACGIRLVAATPSFDLMVGSTYARWLIEELLEASARYGVRFETAPKPYRSAMPDSGHTG